MRLRRYAGTWAVCRLDAASGVPPWFSVSSSFSALVRRGDELSIVLPDGEVPEGVLVERGWTAFEVEGPMEFTLTGVLASVAAPLAEAGIPIFALATYDTDVVLVPGAQDVEALEALRAAGHEVDAA